LNYKFNYYKITEKSLKQKRIYFRDFIKFLNILKILKKADLNDNVNINIIWLEGNNIKKVFE